MLPPSARELWPFFVRADARRALPDRSAAPPAATVASAGR